MNNIGSIRNKRLAAGISAISLAKRARINRVRLSYLENAHVDPSNDELCRLEVGLAELIEAKQRVQQLAAEVGWPTPAGVGY
jgi:transcriptional regulator with XRE-family HTH domain